MRTDRKDRGGDGRALRFDPELERTLADERDLEARLPRLRELLPMTSELIERLARGGGASAETALSWVRTLTGAAPKGPN